MGGRRRSRGRGGRAAGALLAGLAGAAVLLAGAGGAAAGALSAQAASSGALQGRRGVLQDDPANPCDAYNGLSKKRRKRQCKKDPKCYLDAGADDNKGKCFMAAPSSACDGLQKRKACRKGGCKFFKKKMDPKVPGIPDSVANYPFCAEKGGPGPKGTNEIVLERAGVRFVPTGDEWGGVCEYSVALQKVRDLMDIPKGGDYENIEWNKVKKAYVKHVKPLLEVGGPLYLTAEEEAGSPYIQSAKRLYGEDFIGTWTMEGLDGTATGTAPVNSESRRQIVEKAILDWQTARLIAGWSTTLLKYGLSSPQGQNALGKMAALWTGCGDGNRKGGPRHTMWNRAELRGQQYSFQAQVQDVRTEQKFAGTNWLAVQSFDQGDIVPPDEDRKAARAAVDNIMNQLMTVQAQCVVRYSVKLDKDIEEWLKAGNSFGPPAELPKPEVFKAKPRKNQSEGDTFFRVIRPLMALSPEGSGTVPGTADQGFVAASQEIQRIYEVRKDPHMPNPPGSPQNYCYVVNALTAWLKEGVGSTYSDGEWGQWFGLLVLDPENSDASKGLYGAEYCTRKYPTSGAGGTPWPIPSWWCVPGFTCTS